MQTPRSRPRRSRLTLSGTRAERSSKRNRNKEQSKGRRARASPGGVKTSACHASKATRPKTQHVSARIRTRARRESYLSTQAASGRRTAISNAHEIPARYSVPIVSGFLPVSRRALPSATGLFLVPYSSGFSGLEEEASDWTRLCRWRRRAARFAPKCGYTRVWRNYLRARVLPDGD